MHAPVAGSQQAAGQGLGVQAVPGGSESPPGMLQLIAELNRQTDVVGSQQAVAHVVGVQTVPPPWNA